MDVQVTTNKIAELAQSMCNMPEELHYDLPVKHNFSKGVYVREIFMPKGALVVGKIHKTRHLNIVSRGHCIVVTPLRKLTIDATKFPQTFESGEGEQKVVLMLEDTVWSTVHVTEETDVDVIVDQELTTTEYDQELIAKLAQQARECLS